ncbi:hypothetical protein D1007_08950 [Hordeum vulgare]|nr:hypothetical protein D1007_08950 [Hordeum vulgare]
MNVLESQVLIGTCNGLLCFHDKFQGVVEVLEPFTGESIAVPLPKGSMWSRCPEQYCFGYDATARQYKIVHKGHECQLEVFTVGADEGWRTVKIAHASWEEGGPACNDGAVYWRYLQDNEHGIFNRYAHFDLATEEITSVESRRVHSLPIVCHHPWWRRDELCIIQIRWLVGDGESTGGDWPHNFNAMAYEVDIVNLTHGRRLPGRQALHRGHLFMQEKNGTLYAHRIMSKGVHGLDLGCAKLLNGIGVQSSRRWTAEQYISTFAYVPTVAPAPLELYVGAPLASALGVAQC